MTDWIADRAADDVVKRTQPCEGESGSILVVHGGGAGAIQPFDLHEPRLERCRRLCQKDDQDGRDRRHDTTLAPARGRRRNGERIAVLQRRANVQNLNVTLKRMLRGA